MYYHSTLPLVKSETQYHVKRGYTDMTLIVGGTMREAWTDMHDLVRFYPELFLGYDVRLTSPDSRKDFLGYHNINQVIVSENAMWHKEYRRFEEDIDVALHSQGRQPHGISRIDVSEQYWVYHSL